MPSYQGKVQQEASTATLSPFSPLPLNLLQNRIPHHSLQKGERDNKIIMLDLIVPGSFGQETHFAERNILKHAKCLFSLAYKVRTPIFNLLNPI